MTIAIHSYFGCSSPDPAVLRFRYPFHGLETVEPDSGVDKTIIIY